MKPVKGLTWGHAAVGNATWTGARLVDVLKLAGLFPYEALEKGEIQHVHVSIFWNRKGAAIICLFNLKQ